MVKEGAQLDMALKSEPGKIIADALLQDLINHLDAILLNDLSPDDILQRVYRCRGIVSAMGGVGQRIEYARKVVARRIARDQMGYERGERDD